jgi:hypothetical protein
MPELDELDRSATTAPLDKSCYRMVTVHLKMQKMLYIVLYIGASHLKLNTEYLQPFEHPTPILQFV